MENEKIKELELQIAVLKDELKELKELKNTRRVKEGEKYYIITLVNEPHSRQMLDTRELFDDINYKTNNYFTTERRANEVAEKISCLLKLEAYHDKYCPNFVPKWDNGGQINYTIAWWEARRQYTVINCAYYWSETEVYFPTEKLAQKICDELNRELKAESEEKIYE